MIDRRVHVILIIALAAAALAPALAGSEAGRPRMTLGKYVLESEHLEGTLQGPLELSPKVTVTGAGVTITCDRLKVWPAPEGRQIERAEAEGHIVIQGRYTASDRTEWQIIGKADSATYEREAGRGVLVGSVNFQATNATAGTTLTVEAHKLIYDFQSRHFQFERGADPVRVQWQEPESGATAPARPPQQQGGKGETKP